MLGKLTWGAVPFDQPIPLFAGAFVIVVILGVLAFITIKGWILTSGRSVSTASIISGSASCM